MALPRCAAARSICRTAPASLVFRINKRRDSLRPWARRARRACEGAERGIGAPRATEPRGGVPSAAAALGCRSGAEPRLRGRKVIMRAKLPLVVLFLLAPLSVLAHHSFAAEFDANKPLVLKGTITRVDLVNPHAWLYMNVTDS